MLLLLSIRALFVEELFIRFTVFVNVYEFVCVHELLS